MISSSLGILHLFGKFDARGAASVEFDVGVRASWCGVAAWFCFTTVVEVCGSFHKG